MQLARGVYPDLDDKAYHADPCPEPSLNQTTAKALIQKSPLHAWHQHPRLNPAYEPDDNRAFDLGNIAHRLLLGRGRQIHRIAADNYRTKEAQVAKARAYAEGAIPCLEKQFSEARGMRDLAVAQLRNCGIDWLPETHPEARSELVFLWCEGTTWFRTKIDRMQYRLSMDYKTTAGVCDANATMTRAMADGWHIQAAMHERAHLHFEIGQMRYLFIQQESNAPYALGVWEMPESLLDMGRKDLAMAVKLWEECMESETWPSYNNEAIGLLRAPVWGINQWMERHQVEPPLAAE